MACGLQLAAFNSSINSLKWQFLQNCPKTTTATTTGEHVCATLKFPRIGYKKRSPKLQTQNILCLDRSEPKPATTATATEPEPESGPKRSWSMFVAGIWACAASTSTSTTALLACVHVAATATTTARTRQTHCNEALNWRWSCLTLIFNCCLLPLRLTCSGCVLLPRCHAAININQRSCHSEGQCLHTFWWHCCRVLTSL